MLSNFNNYAKTVGPEANLSLQAAPINICQDISHSQKQHFPIQEISSVS